MKNFARFSIVLNVPLLPIILMYTENLGYLGRNLVMTNANYLEVPTDTLSSQYRWQNEVKYKVFVTQNAQLKTCFLGD